MTVQSIDPISIRSSFRMRTEKCTVTEIRNWSVTEIAEISSLDLGGFGHEHGMSLALAAVSL